MTPRTLPLFAPPPSVGAPFSSAAPLAAARAALVCAGQRVWSVLERIGQQRAAGELLRTAVLIEHSQPETARLLRAEAAAWRVR